jgi:hypothetical protein
MTEKPPGLSGNIVWQLQEAFLEQQLLSFLSDFNENVRSLSGRENFTVRGPGLFGPESSTGPAELWDGPPGPFHGPAGHRPAGQGK